MDPDGLWRSIDDQRLRLADLLAGLSEDDWRTPSLCAGWTVREVAAHLTYAQSTLPEILGDMLRHPAGMDRFIRDGALRRAGLPTEELVARIRGMIGSRRHIALVTPRETLIDILVHSQDIAVPLGRPFALDPEASVVAADRVWSMTFPFRARRRFAGQTLVATDADWSVGTGPEVLRAPVGTWLLRLTGR